MFLSLALLACTGVDNPAPAEVVGSQLEALTVGGDVATSAGTLSIEGEGADFTASVGSSTWTVHSPAKSSLADWLDEDVTATVGTADSDWESMVGIEVADADGAIWIGEPGHFSVFAEKRFGEGFATYGDDLGEERRGNYIVDFRAVLFQTDEGEVEAKAGVPVTLNVGGLTYRTTVITAYTTEEAPGAPQYDCMGKPEILSYEMVRVDDAQKWSPLKRDAKLDPADTLGCGEGE